jgi:hypothetical protein
VARATVIKSLNDTCSEATGPETWFPDAKRVLVLDAIEVCIAVLFQPAG